jgi:hypothetical protein
MSMRDARSRELRRDAVRRPDSRLRGSAPGARTSRLPMVHNVLASPSTGRPEYRPRSMTRWPRYRGLPMGATRIGFGESLEVISLGLEEVPL